MNFNVINLDMGLIILEPILKEDERGVSFVTYSTHDFRSLGVNFNISQDIHYIYKKKNTLRGIHYQNEPMAQTKMIRCTKGRILDYIIDLRKGSPTYLKWVSIELNSINKYQLIVPVGFGHAFVTLEDDSEIVYKTDKNYEPLLEKAIFWKDKDINIDWICDKPILSERDANAPSLKESKCNFKL